MRRFLGKIWFGNVRGDLYAKGEFYDPHEDRRRQVWRKVVTTKKDAQNAVLNEIERILGENRSSPKSWTFEDFADWYCKNVAVPAEFRNGVKFKGKKSWRQIHWDVDILTRHFRRRKINGLKRADFLEYREKRLRDPKPNGEPRSIGSVNHELRTLSAMLNFAYSNEWIDRPPNFRGVIQASAETRLERVPTQVEFQAVLDYCAVHNPRLRTFLILIADCGARPIELVNLPWSDVDEESVVLTSDKGTRRRTRRIFLTDRAREAVGQLPRENEFVLGGRRNFRHSFDRYVRKLNLEPFTMYSLRHLYVTRLDALGISPFLKMKLSGHSTVEMSDRYTHFDDDTAREIAAMLSQK